MIFERISLVFYLLILFLDRFEPYLSKFADIDGGVIGIFDPVFLFALGGAVLGIF